MDQDINIISADRCEENGEQTYTVAGKQKEEMQEKKTEDAVAEEVYDIGVQGEGGY